MTDDDTQPPAATGLVAELRKRAQDCHEMGLTVGTKVVGRRCYLDAADMAEPYEAELLRLRTRVEELQATVQRMETLADDLAKSAKQQRDMGAPFNDGARVAYGESAKYIRAILAGN